MEIIDILKRNRLSYNIHHLVKVLFDSSAFLFGNLYIYHEFGFWKMVVFSLFLTMTMSMGMFYTDNLIRKFKPKKVMIFGLFFDLITFYIFAFQLSEAILIPLAIICGIGVSITSNTSSVMVGHNLDDKQEGRQMAWWGNVSTFISMLSPLFSLYIIQSKDFSVLYRWILIGHLISVIPLFFYKDDVHQDGISVQIGLFKELPSLVKKYEFKSDVWRLFLNSFSGEGYITAVMVLIFLVFKDNLMQIGWILTTSAIISMVIKKVMGKRFDDGHININKPEVYINVISWLGFIFSFSNPLLNTIFKATADISNSMVHFPCGTVFYKNIKKNSGSQYAGGVLFLGYLGSVFLYLPLTIIYLLTNDLKTTLYIMTVILSITPLLKYYIYNKQVSE